MHSDFHEQKPTIGSEITRGTAIIVKSQYTMGGLPECMTTIALVKRIDGDKLYVERAYTSTDETNWYATKKKHPKYQGEDLSQVDDAYTIRPIKGDEFDLAYKLGVIP